MSYYHDNDEGADVGAERRLQLAELPHELHLQLAIMVDPRGLAGLEMASSSWRALFSDPASDMWRHALQNGAMAGSSGLKTARVSARGVRQWKRRFVAAFCREQGICPSCFKRAQPGDVGTVCLKKLFSAMRIGGSPRPSLSLVAPTLKTRRSLEP